MFTASVKLAVETLASAQGSTKASRAFGLVFQELSVWFAIRISISGASLKRSMPRFPLDCCCSGSIGVSGFVLGFRVSFWQADELPI